MKNNTLIISLIVAIIIGAGAFYGGMKYQESKSPSFMRFGQAGQFQGRGGNIQMRNGMRPILGEVIDVDDMSVTVKLDDGSTRIVILSDNTSINKAAEGSKADIVIGERISAFGTENSDKSVTAQSIQLNPQMRIIRQEGTPSAQ